MRSIRHIIRHDSLLKDIIERWIKEKGPREVIWYISKYEGKNARQTKSECFIYLKPALHRNTRERERKNIRQTCSTLRQHVLDLGSTKRFSRLKVGE